MKEKIGIISDTHGLLRPEVLEILKDCKYILHAGDVNKDEILDVLRSIGNLYVVRGNNDKDWAENLRTSDTLSPTFTFVTPSPISTTSPENSCPSTIG